jgi:hypothetical protein
VSPVSKIGGRKMHKKTQKTNSISKRNNSIASLLGFVFVALFTIAVSIPLSYAADDTGPKCEKESTSSCTGKAELPREWKWKKPNINFDHMYPSDK